jgi:CBS domain containing-hemolysin-like protein
VIYRLLILIAIIAANGYFAAAEVALVSVRRSRLRTLAEQGSLPAQTALNLLAHPERLLSVTQVGVTLASLGLGWAGEGTVYDLIMAGLGPHVPAEWQRFLHGVSFVIAFVLISYAHVVIGEVVPKNIALEKADKLATLVAPALLVFYRIAGPFVWVLEHTTAAISHWLGLRGLHSSGGHSTEEIKYIVSASRIEGHLHQFEEDAIEALLDLHDYSAREIMVPRSQVVSVSLDATLEQVLHVMREHQYSRLPVYEGGPEHIVGYVHFKDLMRIWEERKMSYDRKRVVRPFRLQRVLRKPLVVPETKPLNDLIDEFRSTHIHMALVVDEFGSITGLVTLEDVLEQIFGEIGDEHDVKRPAPTAGAPVMELDGSTTIRDLANQYDLELPTDAGFETLAGFLLFQLGYIPKAGETVQYGGRSFTVLQMDRNRIARVRIEKLPDTPAATSAGPPTSAVG